MFTETSDAELADAELTRKCTRDRKVCNGRVGTTVCGKGGFIP